MPSLAQHRQKGQNRKKRRAPFTVSRSSTTGLLLLGEVRKKKMEEGGRQMSIKDLLSHALLRKRLCLPRKKRRQLEEAFLLSANSTIERNRGGRVSMQASI